MNAAWYAEMSRMLKEYQAKRRREWWSRNWLAVVAIVYIMLSFVGQMLAIANMILEAWYAGN